MDVFFQQILATIQSISSVPRMRTRVPEGARHLRASDVEEVTFKVKFRFRKVEFWQLMHGLDLVDEHGIPKMLYVHHSNPQLAGKSRMAKMNAESALLVLLRRLASPARLCDLVYEMGASRTIISHAWNYMLEYLMENFVLPVYELERWIPHFDTLTDGFVRAGVPFENIIGVIDGHVQPVSRPGGEGCKGANFEDFQVFNGHDRVHALKYLGLVLSNGLVLVKGPWTGNRHDSACMNMSKMIEVLKHIFACTGRAYMIFGDSAFGAGRHMQKMLKGKNLSHREHCFNAIMARYRICIENVFAEIHSEWGYTSDRYNQKLGLQRVGQAYLVASFLHNCKACLHGSQMSAQYGHDILCDMPLERFLAMRHAPAFDFA
eukprot:CAMPEP_0181322684 /NCGR_PEP_ID=MMETSP1101-20121128/19361_1 /TAXON_ID=46948 /ORGANISM="Rhodomonas abbreviata, Strain Caron Lab Isolate" /LENGTH=375 /DNA_ID=CAMNT_0023430617 /DNA_START=226 /DNA_END=1353 /DNA_ORIENTATION=+